MLGPTGAVLGKQPAYDRRQAVLRAFHEQTRDLTDAQEILTGVARLLTEQLGVDHFIYGEAANGEAATLDAFHATHGVPQGDPSRRFDLRSAFTALVGGHDWQKSRVVEDNRMLGRPANHAVQHAADVMNARAGINVPIIRDGRPVALLTVLDTGPRRWTEDEIALCEELAEQTWTALARARAEAALLERERNQAMLIAWSDRVRDEADPEAIIETTLRMLGEHMGVTRATHSESDASGRLFTVLGEWRRDTISIAGSSFSLDEVGTTVDREWMAGEIVRYDDVTRDPRIEPEVIESYIASEIRGFVSVPLIEDGRVQSALSVQSREPRMWKGSEIQLLRDIAERTWVMLERARAEAELHERQRHQSFLIEWSDAIRGESRPDAIIETTLKCLGEHLGVSRTSFSACDESGRNFTVTGEWRGEDCVSILGNSFALASVGSAVDQAWMSGDIIRYDDVAGDSGLEPSAIARYQTNDIAAFVSIPLIQQGLMRSALSIQHKAPRRWSDSEIQLMCDVAERTWVALERAHAQAALQERNRNQAFLLDWSDRIRKESTARGILAATLAALGEHMGALRTNYAETIAGGRELVIIQEWSQGVPSIINQAYPADALGRRFAASHLSGQPIRIADIHQDDRFDENNLPLFEALGIAALMTVPMIRGGRIVAVLSIHSATPRTWSDNEAELVRDLADRTLTVLERAHSEERLAQNEAQLSAFLENAPVAMHLKDADGRYVRVNPQFARALGLAQEDFLGMHPDELFPPRIAAELARLEARARAGEVVSVEISGDEVIPDSHILSMAFPVTGAGNVRTGGFTLDLTERKRAEAALARSRETLYQTEKLSALGSLLAGVSHELNNPLSIVVAQAVMMERQSRGGELAERAQKIRKAADRCARIVQTFLAMARQKRPERAPVDLNAVAIAAYDLAEYGLKTDGIRATRDLAPSLPPLSADYDQLHQIIINLIVNAQQALAGAGEPGRALTMRTALGEQPGTVILEVADNGPGVPEEARRRIFEPFYTTKPQGEGTGVGLSFSQGIAEAHGGWLELVPTPRGACFRLTLPIDPDAVQPVPEAVAEPEPEVPGRRALVVDDEQEIAESLADFLSIEGFVCDVAIGGAAAQDRLATGNYDLIVSDLRMPGVDGPELHAWLAACRPDLIDRIGFATGDTLGAAAERFLAAVQRPVLEKPFMPDAVHRFLQQMDLA